MQLKLAAVSGPHQGKEYTFDGHDTFLVGRSDDAHFRLSHDDPYFSRRHFLVEVNPPRCRVIDLNSRNGTLLNGKRVQTAEVADGDELRAGDTVFKVSVLRPEANPQLTLDLPFRPARPDDTVDHAPARPVIPGYRLGRELGCGGMGVVYHASRESDGREVALKTITPAEGVGRRQVERFLREGRILARLGHPNIVAYHEVSEANGVIFLAMELVNGPDLGTMLAGHGPQDVRTTARIACQLLAGLAHAHAKGFVHRDIKPANILIGRDGRKRFAKLADFGLAREYESSKLSGLTLQGETGGTPAFIAPEQITHFRQVKPAADQYSAAATLYNLLSGRYTHDLPKDLGAQLAVLITSPPVPLAARKPDVPPALAAVIHKALSREPNDRYPDVSAFQRALLPFAS